NRRTSPLSPASHGRPDARVGRATRTRLCPRRTRRGGSRVAPAALPQWVAGEEGEEADADALQRRDQVLQFARLWIGEEERDGDDGPDGGDHAGHPQIAGALVPGQRATAAGEPANHAERE